MKWRFGITNAFAFPVALFVGPDVVWLCIGPFGLAFYFEER